MKCFKNKTILITGHTGFQAFWLANTLRILKVKNLIGIGLPPTYYQKKLFEKLLSHNIYDYSSLSNICNKKKFISLLEDTQPDYIFHLASQPLVEEGYQNPINTFNSNINGSLNLLEWLRHQKRKIKVIFVTSDKCYRPSNKHYTEIDCLGGLDPYSSSKSIQEILVESYNQSFYLKDNYIKIATARSGNIYGGGDFTPGRLIPDIINSFHLKKKLILRNPNYTRPWQFISDSISGYLSIGQYLSQKNVIYHSFNFGPNNRSKITVKKILNLLENISNKKINIELSKNKFSESKNLNLISKRANLILKWKNKHSLLEGLKETYNWYDNYFNNYEDIISFSQNKIREKLDQF